MADEMRENTVTENQVIKEGHYTIANNITESKLPPAAKAEVPYLNFSLVQNAVSSFDKVCSDLNVVITSNSLTAAKKNELNKNLFKAEQALLTAGLPRRPWYRHSIYAPGFYTGYGVKTLPGIREALEQRNWKEAQEQIEITAAAINNLVMFLQGAIKNLQ
jgi:N-acetylated-alpha-linked acidic dipeptidase